MKLTKPQLELLTYAVGDGRANCAEYYPPAMKLIELGLAVRKEGRFSGWLEPTDAGRALIKPDRT